MISVWSTTNITLLNRVKKIKKLQNFAVKVAIGGASKFDHASSILNKLQWLPIRQKVIYEQCLTSFKIMKNYLPNWLFCFPHVRNVNSTNTRQQNMLRYTSLESKQTQTRSITVRGPKLWNNLPSAVKECNSLHALKAELKTSCYIGLSILTMVLLDIMVIATEK